MHPSQLDRVWLDGILNPPKLLEIIQRATIKACWASSVWPGTPSPRTGNKIIGQDRDSGVHCVRTGCSSMDRKQKISKILNKVNERFHLVFEWLTSDDLRKEYLIKLSEKGGRDTDPDPQSSQKL